MSEQERRELVQWCEAKDFISHVDFTRDGYETVIVKLNPTCAPGQITRLCNRAYAAGLMPHTENGRPLTLTLQQIPLS